MLLVGGYFLASSAQTGALCSSVDAGLKDFLTFVFSFQATFKGWMDIMYAAVDSRGVGCHTGLSA